MTEVSHRVPDEPEMLIRSQGGPKSNVLMTNAVFGEKYLNLDLLFFSLTSTTSDLHHSKSQQK